MTPGSHGRVKMGVTRIILVVNITRNLEKKNHWKHEPALSSASLLDWDGGRSDPSAAESGGCVAGGRGAAAAAASRAASGPGRDRGRQFWLKCEKKVKKPRGVITPAPRGLIILPTYMEELGR